MFSRRLPEGTALIVFSGERRVAGLNRQAGVQSARQGGPQWSRNWGSKNGRFRV